uniref:Olfactory receptor 92 n=1 Tax=Aulacocentrum confusum TaxID=2767324 RepID=A0A7G8Z9B1_9HYME|nr:olfactory receptor 92 [Aulacocentrum confusum]
MMIYRKDAGKLHQNLDPKFLELLKIPQLPRILLNDVSSFRWLCKILNSFIYLSVAVFIMTPLISMANQQFHQIHPIKNMFVIPGAYPWKISPNGLFYKIHFIVESASIIFAFLVSGGIDSLFTLYIFQISGQLREMSYRITHTNSKTTGHKKIIRECILQHEVLMQCRDIYFFLFFQSQKYKEAVYGSHWQSNKNFMTSIIIMLGQRPLILTACKFSIVSIDIFVKVKPIQNF